MEFLPAFFLVLFCIHFGEIKSGLQSEFTLLSQNGVDESSDIRGPQITTESVSTTPVAEQDSLQSVSIQDLILSGIDGNEKIQKKIISEIKDFPTNFRNYGKPIQLTITDYSFPKKMIKYDMNEGYIVYRNVSVSQWYDYDNNQFSVSVRCDSSSTAAIQVGLLMNIKVDANFSISHPLAETTTEGSITILIKNSAISKEVSYTNRTGINLEQIIFKISLTHSHIDIDFEGPHKLIYNRLEAFFDEIQSSLKEFFANQLDEKMNEYQLNLQFDCSRIRFAEPNIKKINLPYYNNFINNLYVIPETKIESWKGITLSAGPIVIDGFSFNSTELSISRKYIPNYGYTRQLISRIKTGNLKGKFQWNYNQDLNNESGQNSSSIFYFSIDKIAFESDIAFNDNRADWNNMNVNVGKTKIKPSSSNSNLDELKFAEFVLSEYLKSAVTESLKSSLMVRNDNSQMSFARNIFNNYY